MFELVFLIAITVIAGRFVGQLINNVKVRSNEQAIAVGLDKQRLKRDIACDAEFVGNAVHYGVAKTENVYRQQAPVAREKAGRFMDSARQKAADTAQQAADKLNN